MLAKGCSTQYQRQIYIWLLFCKALYITIFFLWELQEIIISSVGTTYHHHLKGAYYFFFTLLKKKQQFLLYQKHRETRIYFLKHNVKYLFNFHSETLPHKINDQCQITYMRGPRGRTRHPTTLNRKMCQFFASSFINNFISYVNKIELYFRNIIFHVLVLPHSYQQQVTIFLSRGPRSKPDIRPKNYLRQISVFFASCFTNHFKLIKVYRWYNIYSYFTILAFPLPHMPVINKLWPSIALFNENWRLSHILQFWQLIHKVWERNRKWAVLGDFPLPHLHIFSAILIH